MTIYSSQQISGMMQQQLGMFSGHMAYGQQLSYGLNQGMFPGQAPPPPVQAPNLTFMNTGPGQAGMYGEQVAARMASAGRTGLGMGGAAMGVLGGLTGMPLDPFSAALSAGRIGFGAAGGMGMGMGGGLAMGGLAAGAAALPFYAASKAAQVYGGAFMGGMQDQAGLNSTLRSNFQHFGGQGAFGRGFSQGQMGQIGGTMAGELRQNPFTSAGELNQLISGGAQMGMFTGTRDVSSFTQNFKKMLDTLKSVQRELGGALTDALQFVRSSQQAGIYQNADRVNFAAEVRTAEAVTGMNRNQLTAIAAQGAQISRAFGGVGRQGAFGAIRAVEQVGAAVQGGFINQELLSEVTGGLQGQEAVAALSQRMLQRSGQFARRPMGRWSTFAMSNAQGTGLNQEMMDRFLAGDISVGDVRGAAQRNVGSMGRARAINNEGMLRGAVMEQGGMAAQIGMMRLTLGDRVMDRGDDFAQLVMQRRFGMGKQEAQLMTGMMRNQGNIAQEESFGRISARREQEQKTEYERYRSMDAVMTQFSHGVQEATGVTRAREMGREFMTKLSSTMERVMNDILGVTSSNLSRGDMAALNRISVGRATREDLERMSAGGMGSVGPSVSGQDLFRRSIADQVLGGLGMHTRATAGEMLQARGGMRRGEDPMWAFQRALSASAGIVTGADATDLKRLEANRDSTVRQIQGAQMMTEGLGTGNTNFYRAMSAQGVSGNALDAFMQRQGMSSMNDMTAGMVTPRGRANMGMIQRDVGRAGALGGIGMALGGPLAGIGAAAYSLFRGETLAANRDPRQAAVEYYAGGGEAARTLEKVAGGQAVRDVGVARQGAAGAAGEAALGALAGPLGLGYVMATQGTELIGMQDRVRNVKHAQRMGIANMAANMRVSTGAMEAVTESESFRAHINRLANTTDRAAMNRELGRMRAEAGSSSLPPEQRRAYIGMITNLEQQVASKGQIDESAKVLGIDPAIEEARRAEVMRRAGDYSGMAEQLKGSMVGRGLAQVAGAMLKGAGPEGVNMAGAQLVTSIAAMAPGTTEYEDAVRALSGTESGRAVLMGAANQRRFVRDLSGQGRRGRLGAVETGLSAITGGTIGEMSFEIAGPGGRTREIRGAQAVERMLARGGRGAEQIRSQLTTEMQTRIREAGGDESAAGRLVEAYTSRRGGGFTEREAQELYAETGREGGAISRMQQKERQTGAERTDPLGKQRNDLIGAGNKLLGGVQTKIDRVAEEVGKVARAIRQEND